MSTVTSVTTTLRRRRGLTEEAAVAAVDQACRRLRLPTMRALLGDAVAAANKDQLTYTGFLAELLLAECDDRDRRRVLLGDHDFDPAASFEADLRAADADVVANRRVRHLNGVVFLDEADVDPAGGVPLLPRRLKVGAEHVVDGRLERIQPGRGTHRGLPRRWFRGREGPANGAASDLVLACERSDRHALDPGVPTDRSEQFHTHPHPETHFRCREDRWMRVLLTPRKWVQIKPSRRHAEARVGPESDRHTGPESDCHRHVSRHEKASRVEIEIRRLRGKSQRGMRVRGR
ncbi:hypothetical protein FHT43_006818 [Mycolicibacterium sp. BK607]|nr:hypothetical protein [Mycolicibacterium sp. BK607]